MCRSQLVHGTVVQLLDCVFDEICKRGAEDEEWRSYLRCLQTQDAEETAIWRNKGENQKSQPLNSMAVVLVACLCAFDV